MKEITATITSKGQVTIPVEVRKYLGLGIRDKVIFVLEPEGVVRLSVPRYRTISSLRGAAGTLEQPMSWGEMKRTAHEDRLAAKDRPS